MTRPGPKKRPALEVVREGNAGHHGADRLAGGLHLEASTPDEPDWSEWWPGVRIPTAKQLHARYPIDVVEGSLAHIEEDGKRVHLAAARRAFLMDRDKRQAEEAKVNNQRAREVARKEWTRVVGRLGAAGLLTELDASVLVDHCRVWAQIDQCIRDVAAKGVWVQGERGAVKNPSMTALNQLRTQLKWTAGEFGLTPPSRDDLPSGDAAGEGDSPFD